MLREGGEEGRVGVRAWDFILRSRFKLGSEM